MLAAAGSTGLELPPERLQEGSRLQERVPLADSCLLGAAALLLYALLAQQTCYGDACEWLLRNDGSKLIVETHGAYVWLLLLGNTISQGLGGTQYEAGVALSAIGGGIGCGLVHRASVHLGLMRRDALLVAAWTAVTPAVMFFSTVLELHGPFLAFSGLASLAFARWVRAPSARSSAWFGAACGLAYYGHATGIGLPALFLILAWCLPGSLRGPGRAKTRRLAGIVVCVHAAVVFGGSWLLRQSGLAVNPARAADFLLLMGSRHAPAADALIGTLCNDWLLPFLPVSLLWLAAIRLPRLRSLVWGFSACLSGYLAVTFVLLGRDTEHGAYLLPLAWPAILIVFAALPRAVLIAGLGLSFVIGWHKIAEHDQPERGRSYERGLRRLFAEAPPLLLLGGPIDVEARFVQMPEQPYVYVLDLATLDQALVRDRLADLERHLLDAIRSYGAVVLTDGAEHLLDLPVARTHTSSGILLDFMRERFDLVPVAAEGFAGKLLRPRE